MKITDIRINGICEPLGFELPSLSLSWKVCETGSRRPVCVQLLIAGDADFQQILYREESSELPSSGTAVPIALQDRKRY